MRRSQRWGRWGPLAKSSRSTSITPDSPAKLRQTIPRFTASGSASPPGTSASSPRTADYWQWRVKTCPQDPAAALENLLEARYHLLAAGALDQATDLTAKCREPLEKPYSTRGIRAMLTRYANAAGLKNQGIDDALIQPYSGHESRQSLEIYSRLALVDAQQRYDQVITRFPV